MPAPATTSSNGAWLTRRLLNDAYRTLKDPLHRTEYLLKLRGAEIGEEHSGKDRKDPSRVPADLLEEVFELNMQLEEMRMARKTGEKDPELQASLEQAKRKFDGLLDEVDQDLRNAVAGVGRGRRRSPQDGAKRPWWPCSTGGATSATWFAT